MIAVVITAILATVAVTSYTSFVLKAHRTEAKTALLDMASLEERYLSTNNCYTNSMSALGYGTAPFPVTFGSGYYEVASAPTFSCGTAQTANATATPASFSITVVPVPGGPQAADTACASFTVTSTGARTATMTSAGGPDNTAVCWQ